VILLPEHTPGLSARERFALEILVDFSRLLPVRDDAGRAAAVRLEPVEAAPSAPAFAPADGVVRVSRATLARVTDLAGAGAEQRSTAADRFGRVPAEANPQVREGRALDPAVSLLGAGLRAAAASAAGPRQLVVLSPWPSGRRWATAFTHDLDVVSGWPVFTAMRMTELLRRGRLTRAARVAAAALGSLSRPPVQIALEDILRLEREHGIRSTWFVLAGTPTPGTWARGDITYRLEAVATRRLLEAIAGGGNEVGLHGSFATWQSAERLQQERARLAGVVGAEPAGLRQHFLRMRPGVTPRAAAEAGFDYDASSGFADRSGFRLGAADVVPAWDERRSERVALELAPLVWMDRAASKYRGIEDPDRWADEALAAAEACRAADGLWVGLWHPNLAPALGYPGAPAAYRRVVAEVAGGGPWVAPLGEIVAWRRARRGLAGRITGPGQFELEADRPGRWTVALETPGGRSLGERPWPGVGSV
jgi:hypothetical protein